MDDIRSVAVVKVGGGLRNKDVYVVALNLREILFSNRGGYTKEKEGKEHSEVIGICYGKDALDDLIADYSIAVGTERFRMRGVSNARLDGEGYLKRIDLAMRQFRIATENAIDVSQEYDLMPDMSNAGPLARTVLEKFAECTIDETQTDEEIRLKCHHTKNRARFEALAALVAEGKNRGNGYFFSEDFGARIERARTDGSIATLRMATARFYAYGDAVRKGIGDLQEKALRVSPVAMLFGVDQVVRNSNAPGSTIVEMMFLAPEIFDSLPEEERDELESLLFKGGQSVTLRNHRPDEAKKLTMLSRVYWEYCRRALQHKLSRDRHKKTVFEREAPGKAARLFIEAAVAVDTKSVADARRLKKALAEFRELAGRLAVDIHVRHDPENGLFASSVLMLESTPKRLAETVSSLEKLAEKNEYEPKRGELKALRELAKEVERLHSERMVFDFDRDAVHFALGKEDDITGSKILKAIREEARAKLEASPFFVEERKPMQSYSQEDAPEPEAPEM